jgi:hypothetical protein
MEDTKVLNCSTIEERSMIDARIDPFLYSYFAGYGRGLREDYPGHKLLNATVVQSALYEFSQRGLITLVKTANGIPAWLPRGKVKLVKAKNGQPIWMPTQKLLQDWMKIFVSLKPVLRGDSLCWIRTGLCAANAEVDHS